VDESWDTWIKVWVDAEGNLHVEEHTGPHPEPEYAWTA
jgi:hypothetical protein